jgi:hypothetical protein
VTTIFETSVAGILVICTSMIYNFIHIPSNLCRPRMPITEDTNQQMQKHPSERISLLNSFGSYSEASAAMPSQSHWVGPRWPLWRIIRKAASFETDNRLASQSNNGLCIGTVMHCMTSSFNSRLPSAQNRTITPRYGCRRLK